MITSFISNLADNDNLISRCIRGIAVLGTGSMVERGARFVRNMILARLLAPEHFGLMALVLATSQLFEALTEVGVRQAVVQNKGGDRTEYMNVAWWFSTMRGLFLYLTGWLAAPWLASFYHEPALVALLRFAFLTLPLQGLISPGLYVLEKKLTFRRVVFVTQGSGLIGTMISLILALYYPNVWSLAIGFVVTYFIRFFGSFFIYPFKPRFQFDRQAARELFRFSRGMFGLTIMAYLFLQADIFVLGRLCSKQMLGYYSLALNLAMIPQMLFSRIFAPIVLPIFSEIQEQKERLRNNLLRMTSMLYLFGLPLACCLAIFARPILEIVYGSDYGQVRTAFAFLNFFILFYIAGTLIASIFFAVGRPEIHRWFVIIQLFLIMICIYPAIKWAGATGAAAAKLGCMGLASIVQLYILRKLLNLPIRQYLMTAKEGLMLSLGVSILAFLWRYWTNSVWHQLTGGIILCSLAWLIGIWFLRGTMIRAIHQIRISE